MARYINYTFADDHRRLTCLDVFRGVTIAGMIIVNNPGSRQYVYLPLQHAPWHGCTPADLIFPCFLFIAGAAMALSIEKSAQAEQMTRRRICGRILRRCFILFALGLLLNGFPSILERLTSGASLDFSSFRIMGVLQRISLAYLLAGFGAVGISAAKLWRLAGVVLAGYWGALLLVPVPGFGAGDLSPEGNPAAYLDQLILTPPHMYLHGCFDPEGLLSTLPAAVTVLSGYFVCRWLRLQPVKSITSLKLILTALILAAGGKLWGSVFPVNKVLWSSSYVLLTAGWALLFLAVCYEVVEVRGWRRWGRPFEVMGLNAISLYFASGLLARILLNTHIGAGPDAPTTHTRLYENLFVPWAGRMNGSLAFALAYLLLWWFVLYGMYRQRWFIKV